MVALLHDVVADSAWTLQALLKAGFLAEVVAGVDGLTKRAEAEGSEASYDRFIARAAQNPRSKIVKIADLEDMDIRRRREVTSYTMSGHANEPP
ncbi:hypothetical protein [Candidatus Cyanaurora vandensis]|uniref:hypothetical protein n=1 Tax=Candidatus Cyanaurora vandensis TaxID=2714958 RepID=UPI00257EC443|nr:hypothetical protein [Candidatus Cyanaurora vandensis]